MTEKEYLNQAYILARDIKGLQEQINTVRSIAEGSTCSYGDSTSGQHTVGSRVEAGAIVLTELMEQLNGKKLLFSTQYWEIATTIDRLENPAYRELIRLRYLCFKTWEEVAVAMRFSWRHTMRLHSKALAAMKRVIECHIASVI